MNDEASQEIKALLNGDYFDTPKPTKLLKKIISIISVFNRQKRRHIKVMQKKLGMRLYLISQKRELKELERRL